MSSFYGISPNQKPFVFDRIYGNYTSALAAASAENGDGVYPGRYILIEYDSPFSDNVLKNIYQRIDKDKQGQDIKTQELLSLKIIQEIEKQEIIEEKNQDDTIKAKYKELLIEKTIENSNTTIKIIARQSSTDENNLDNFDKITIFKITIETGKEQEKETIGIYIKQNNIIIPNEIKNNYDKNKWVDENYSPISDRKNYDSTVWMKKANSSNNINPKLEDFYVNVAELNSPGLELSEVDLGFPKDEEGNILPLDSNRTPIIEATDAITLTKENSEDEGKLTQNLTVQIQSIGKAISDIYDLLYGYDNNGTTRTIPASYTYKSVAALLQDSSVRFPGTITGDPYLGYSKDDNDESKDGKLIHVNNNRVTTAATIINKNIINLTETTDNKIKYSLQTITTDTLGHIIDINTATKTTTIDLSIGATNSTDNNTLWGNIHNINSIIGLTDTNNTDTDNLWGNIHNINNIVGSSTTTNTDTGNLWGNIHNINKNIGSINTENTLWGDIQQLWNNIKGTDFSPGLWGEINSVNNNITSINNKIGSSSDPTNTTTVWSNIERINSILATPTYTTYTFTKDEAQYISGDFFSSKKTKYDNSTTDYTNWKPSGYDARTNFFAVFTEKLGKTPAISKPSSNGTYTLSDFNSDFQIKDNNGNGIDTDANYTTYIEKANINDAIFKKNRQYILKFKTYEDGTLECDGTIKNIIINYIEQSKISYNFISPSDDIDLLYLGYTKGNTYKNMTYLYPFTKNKYSLLPTKPKDMTNEDFKKYKFISPPEISITVGNKQKSFIEKDNFQITNITKEGFSGLWIADGGPDKKDIDATGEGASNPYRFNIGKEITFLVNRAAQCADIASTAETIELDFNNKDTYIGNNDFAELSFHAVGRWK